LSASFDFMGQSGSNYRFGIPERLTFLPSGGHFMYARQTPQGFEVLYLGETENLSVGAERRWREAVETHGASHLLVRLNTSGRIRRDEHDDMVRLYDPPMNHLESTR